MVKPGARRTRWAVGALCLPIVFIVAACKPEEPSLIKGDIDGAQVRFEQDRPLADNVANRHCAQFGRVARFIGSGEDTGFYECDLR